MSNRTRLCWWGWRPLLLGPACYANLHFWLCVWGPLVHAGTDKSKRPEWMSLAQQYVYFLPWQPLPERPHTHYSKIIIELTLAFLADWTRRAEQFMARLTPDL